MIIFFYNKVAQLFTRFHLMFNSPKFSLAKD